MMKYIRNPIEGIPIRYKIIKGRRYAYQVLHAYRDKETGKVKKIERYLGAVKPGRKGPLKGKASPLKGRTQTKEAIRKMSATKQGIPYDNWEAFACKHKYCPKFNEACRESNREKYGRRCFICGKTEKVNGRKLSVHHVDMDRAQGCKSNWKLVPLCMQCHAKAHNDELIARLGYLLKIKRGT